MDLLSSQTLTVHESNGVVYYTFPAFDALGFIRHGFSTRLGGVSTGIYKSMNLSFTRGDDPHSVRENFKRFCHAIHVDASNVVISAQEHHTAIYNVTAADCGRGITRERGYSDIDGLITNHAEVVLCTQYADCVPLFFADPVKKVVATAHAGWKGTAARIGAVTVERMCSDYGCSPNAIIAGIGPSIGFCCFEVDSPVYEIFAAMDESDTSCFKDMGNGKYHVDLWEINRRVLVKSGIATENITVTDLCTRCNPDVFWSHRAEGNTRGSLAAFISLV
ncbi:MAG TPA: peptidoglycan editing factor PgeF [Ruminococcaceae bacterium]|nr:peptidoglycan editing factor PgeF [Oscillospiraceae bacterium]